MKKVLLLMVMCCSMTVLAEKTQVSILVDAGHGGKDPGHLPHNSSGLQEKVLALEIAMKVGNYLTTYLSNVNIEYTRVDDSYPTLDQRVDQANSGQFDLMLSIHINGSPRSEVYGTETLIHNYDSKQSFSWAKLIEQQFKKRAGRKSRGVKTSADLGHSLQILKFTKIPTVIVECGFITNINEAAYLNSIYGQEIIASAIFRATREYLQSTYKSIDFSPPPAVEPTLEPESAVSSEEEEVESYYTVQIMASIDPVNLDIPQFKKLDKPVNRVEVETTSLYKYKYYVGSFASKKEAKTLQKEIQENGFADAFVTYIK